MRGEKSERRSSKRINVEQRTNSLGATLFYFRFRLHTFQCNVLCKFRSCAYCHLLLLLLRIFHSFFFVSAYDLFSRIDFQLFHLFFPLCSVFIRLLAVSLDVWIGHFVAFVG